MNKIIKELIEGLQILDKYPNGYISAEHDIIYAGPEDISKITSEDQKALKKLGWHLDTENNCWATFV